MTNTDWKLALCAAFVLIFALAVALGWVWTKLAQLANVVEQMPAGKH
jgi:hypothetical protein